MEGGNNNSRMKNRVIYNEFKDEDHCYSFVLYDVCDIYIVTYNLRERECHAGCIIPSITRPVRTDKMQSMERAITAVCFWFYIRHGLMVRWSALAITKHTRILIYLNETRQRLIGNFGMTDHLNSALFLYLHHHPYSQALNHTPLLVD